MSKQELLVQIACDAGPLIRTLDKISENLNKLQYVQADTCLNALIYRVERDDLVRMEHDHALDGNLHITIHPSDRVLRVLYESREMLPDA